jgi:hypothetical protein
MADVTEKTSEIVLVDLSSIAHPIWHMSQAEPDPNHTSQQIVARVHALASQQPYVAICCDGGRSFRKDIAESYKANRPESEAPLHHQIALACEPSRRRRLSGLARQGLRGRRRDRDGGHEGAGARSGRDGADRHRRQGSAAARLAARAAMSVRDGSTLDEHGCG